jgi:hypothetical protein
MPEGLKNAGCTFSRMIAIVLHQQIRRNILAYVDDIVVPTGLVSSRVNQLHGVGETPSSPPAASDQLTKKQKMSNTHTVARSMAVAGGSSRRAQ